MTQAEYQHSFDGFTLNAISLDPELSESGLIETVEREISKPKPDMSAAAQAIDFINGFGTFMDIQINVSYEPYTVPKRLSAFREALGNRFDASRKLGAQYPKNGNVAIVKGDVKLPLTLCQGGYYDFKATEPQAVPQKLEEELRNAPLILENLLQLKEYHDGKLLDPSIESFRRLADSYEKMRGLYPEGKNIRELLKDWEVSETERARYLRCAHIIFSNRGREWMFIQRAKNLGVAADCMSSPGSTPDPIIDGEFNLSDYMKSHLDQEMREEFNLRGDEWQVNGVNLYDDRDSMPFMAVGISTKLSSRDIAQRCLGNKEVLKEHNIIYTVKIDQIEDAIKQLPLYYSIGHIMKDFVR